MLATRRGPRGRGRQPGGALDPCWAARDSPGEMPAFGLRKEGGEAQQPEAQDLELRGLLGAEARPLAARSATPPGKRSTTRMEDAAAPDSVLCVEAKTAAAEARLRSASFHAACCRAMHNLGTRARTRPPAPLRAAAALSVDEY